MSSNRNSYLAAGGFIAILALWMASGLLSDKPNAASKTSESANQAENSQDQDANLMKVEVQEIKSSVINREITLQGQLEPKRHLMIRSQTTGLVSELPITKGSRVDVDTPLLKLTLDGRDMSLLEAQAKIQKAISGKRAATSLRKQGLQSQLQLEQASADLATARAALSRIQLEISQTEIRAPFAGIINDIPVDIGQQIDHGTVVAEIIDDSSFVVTTSVAQQTVQHLSQGQPVAVKLITGTELQGVISFISAVADAKTRTFTVEAEVTNKDRTNAAGVSASIIIPVEKIEAIFLSPSSIALGEDGEIGVKTIDDNDIVEFHVVSLVTTNSDGAWVTGVPSGKRVITLGQGFVNAGEKVIPINAVTDAR